MSLVIIIVAYFLSYLMVKLKISTWIGNAFFHLISQLISISVQMICQSSETLWSWFLSKAFQSYDACPIALSAHFFLTFEMIKVS